MLKIRRTLGRHIFNMGTAIPGKTVFLIETAPSIYLSAEANLLQLAGMALLPELNVVQVEVPSTLEYVYYFIKVRSHMRGADVDGDGRKIGFNTNHYMRSHIRGRGAEAERQQNPLRNKWVQHPIFRVGFETACSKPSLSSRNGRSVRVRSAFVWTYPL